MPLTLRHCHIAFNFLCVVTSISFFSLLNINLSLPLLLLLSSAFNAWEFSMLLFAAAYSRNIFIILLDFCCVVSIGISLQRKVLGKNSVCKTSEAITSGSRVIYIGQCLFQDFSQGPSEQNHYPALIYSCLLFVFVRRLERNRQHTKKR